MQEHIESQLWTSDRKLTFVIPLTGCSKHTHACRNQRKKLFKHSSLPSFDIWDHHTQRSLLSFVIIPKDRKILHCVSLLSFPIMASSPLHSVHSSRPSHTTKNLNLVSLFLLLPILIKRRLVDIYLGSFHYLMVNKQRRN